MSTGSENEQTTQTQTTQTQTTQTQPLISFLPSSPYQPAAESPSSDVSEQVLLLLNNADNKTLCEVICNCQNFIKSRIISDDLNILNKQFSVVPDVLTAYIQNQLDQNLLSPCCYHPVMHIHLNLLNTLSKT